MQGVSTEFVLIEKVRVCKVLDKHRSLSKHTTNEYELRTHTLQARCGTFTLLRFPRYFHVTPYPNLELLKMRPEK